MTDTTVTKQEVLSTTDYSIFKRLKGNRFISQTHVKQLVRSMVDGGNLTQNFPIIINEDHEVIDGQHRIEALKQLNWPVFYVIQEGLSIQVVRDLNGAGSNWGWQAYANSWAEMGHDDYQRLLQLVEDFNIGFHIIMLYTRTSMMTGSPHTKHNKHIVFKNGDYKLSPEQYQKARILLDQYDQLRQLVPLKAQSKNPPASFATACYNIMQSPTYDHKRMIHKLNLHGPSNYKMFNQTKDNMHELEDIYNWRTNEDKRVRLY